MLYRENKNSAINNALKCLEESQRAKQERTKDAGQSSFLLKDLFASQALNTFEHSDEHLQTVVKESQKIFKSVAVKMQREIDKDPWMFIGKLAVSTFGLGMMLGRRSPLRRRNKK